MKTNAWDSPFGIILMIGATGALVAGLVLPLVMQRTPSSQAVAVNQATSPNAMDTVADESRYQAAPAPSQPPRYQEVYYDLAPREGLEPLNDPGPAAAPVMAPGRARDQSATTEPVRAPHAGAPRPPHPGQDVRGLPAASSSSAEEIDQ